MKRIKAAQQTVLEYQIKSHKTKHSIAKTKSYNRNKTRHRSIRIIKKIDDVKKILCIGCRSCVEISYFRNKGYDTTGIDIISASKCKDFIQMDAHNLTDKFEHNSFDLVFASHVLEHIFDVDSVLKAIRKIVSKAIYIVLPIPKTRKPTLAHCSLFDIMLAVRKIPNSAKQWRLHKLALVKNSSYFEDFNCLLPYKLLYINRYNTNLELCFLLEK